MEIFKADPETPGCSKKPVTAAQKHCQNDGKSATKSAQSNLEIRIKIRQEIQARSNKKLEIKRTKPNATMLINVIVRDQDGLN